MDASPTRTTVLFIDPHKEDREYWTQHLNISSPEYVVLEAETGNGGLLICRQQRVDCVLVELSLPDMSGFQVLINLVPRVRHPEIAVIVLTRHALFPMGDLAMKNGAQEYLVKSYISGENLDAAIQKAILRRFQECTSLIKILFAIVICHSSGIKCNFVSSLRDLALLRH